MVAKFRLTAALVASCALCLVSACTSGAPAPPEIPPPDDGPFPDTQYEWHTSSGEETSALATTDVLVLETANRKSFGLLAAYQFAGYGLYDSVGDSLELLSEHQLFIWDAMDTLTLDHEHVIATTGLTIHRVDNSGDILQDQTLESPGTVFDVSLEADAQGLPVAAFVSGGDLFFTRYEPADNLWSLPQLVHASRDNDAPDGKTGSHQNPNLIRLTDGTLLLTCGEYGGDGQAQVLEWRSLDGYGDAWSEPAQFEAGSQQRGDYRAGQVRHTMVDDLPYIVYFAGATYFKRALNTEATEWSEPVEIAPALLGSFYTRSDIAFAAGRPFVVYEDRGIRVRQALDRLGESWGEPQLIDAEGTGRTNFALMGNRLAVGYMQGDILHSRPTLAWTALTPDPPAQPPIVLPTPTPGPMIPPHAGPQPTPVLPTK